MRTDLIAVLILASLLAGRASAQQEPGVIGTNATGNLDARLQDLKQQLQNLKTNLDQCAAVSDAAQKQACLKDAMIRLKAELGTEVKPQVDALETRFKDQVQTLKDHQAEVKTKLSACKQLADADARGTCLKQVARDEKSWWKAKVEEAKAKAKAKLAALK